MPFALLFLRASYHGVTENRVAQGGFMEYVINGGRALSGKVNVNSAKNSVLPVLAAAVLSDGETVVKRCPEISDVKNMAEILKSIGAGTEFSEGNLIVDARGADKTGFSDALASKVRTSVLFLGALSARFGKAEIPYPGGCDIGGRPIDIHINALKELGAKIKEENGKIICFSPVKGGKTALPFPSVGATENIILGAVLAQGETTLLNAAKEPEIADLANCLNSLGAKVSGAGGSVIKIEGVKRLNGGAFLPSSDRIEAGTFLIAAAITGGEVEVKGIKAENIYSLIGKLCDNTCKISIKDDIIYIRGGKRRKCFSLCTGPYPEFPTDLQAQATALAAVSGGVSMIEERVFTERFHHVGELVKMGADISLNGGVAKVKGVARLHGATVSAHDLRCGAALVLAGLNAEGTTVIKDVRHIERGYYFLDKKLAGLGADISRI